MDDILAFDMLLEYLDELFVMVGIVDQIDCSGYLKWIVMPVILLLAF